MADAIPLYNHGISDDWIGDSDSERFGNGIMKVKMCTFAQNLTRAFAGHLCLLFSQICVLCTGGGDSNKGKSKKWRRILQFPHISQCIGLKDKLGKSMIIHENSPKHWESRQRGGFLPFTTSCRDIRRDELRTTSNDLAIIQTQCTCMCCGCCKKLRKGRRNDTMLVARSVNPLW